MTTRNSTVRLVALLMIGLISLSGPALAKIDLVSLPEEGDVTLTIYKPANLTFVKEQREITLTDGTNRLQFDWSETRIDPTSVKMTFPERDDVRIEQISFPPESTETLIWTVEAEEAGKATVEISYFTLGISWEAFYQADLDGDENSMDMKGYVKIDNGSGEQFDSAKTRLLMGKVNLLHSIADVIKAWNRKHKGEPRRPRRRDRGEAYDRRLMEARAVMSEAPEKKEITTEGVSEYYLMSIEGRETLRDGWSKRLEFLNVSGVPVENHYRYGPEKNGENVRRMVRFTNDEGSNLGEKPLPAGEFQLYKKSSDRVYNLIGSPDLEYLPVGEKARVWLGPTKRVRVSRVVMDRSSSDFQFDDNGELSGWKDVRSYRTRVQNFRSHPVTVELHHQFPDRHWGMIEHSHEYESVAYNRIRRRLRMDPGEEVTLNYQIRFLQGVLRE